MNWLHRGFGARSECSIGLANVRVFGSVRPLTWNMQWSGTLGWECLMYVFCIGYVFLILLHAGMFSKKL